jgi:hypothetical protein
MDIYYGLFGAIANLIVYGVDNFPPVYTALIRGFGGAVVSASAFRLGDRGFHSRYAYTDSYM